MEIGEGFLVYFLEDEILLLCFILLEITMNDGKLKSLITSRRFWVSAVGLAAVCSSELFGITLDTEQIVGVATIVVAWVIGDTVRETT